MKLVLVHGRSQADRSADLIRSEWTDALARGFEAAGMSAPEGVDLRVPFYGARLDELTRQIRERVENVVERGASDPAAISDLEFAFLLALKEGAGISDDEVRREMDREIIERGPQNWEFVHAIGRLLSRHVPWLSGPILSRFLADVDAYLSFPHVNEEVNGLVRREIEGTDPCVVVGHSLGSVVSYWVLSRLGDTAKIPLLVTVGSPLGIDAVKRKLPRPLAIPPAVDAWLNAIDERDVVALYSRLDADTFVRGIENVSDIHNPRGREHWIGGYLADRIVAHRIAQALSKDTV